MTHILFYFLILPSVYANIEIDSCLTGLVSENKGESRAIEIPRLIELFLEAIESIQKNDSVLIVQKNGQTLAYMVSGERWARLQRDSENFNVLRIAPKNRTNFISRPEWLETGKDRVVVIERLSEDLVVFLKPDGFSLDEITDRPLIVEQSRVAQNLFRIKKALVQNITVYIHSYDKRLAQFKFSKPDIKMNRRILMTDLDREFPNVLNFIKINKAAIYFEIAPVGRFELVPVFEYSL